MGQTLFHEKKEWYYHDSNDSTRGFKLTDKAPPKAVESYNKFYKEKEAIEIDENGEEWISD